MWYFLNANLTNKAVLVLHPLHKVGEEIGAAFKADGADVHIHGEQPQPDCTTITLHPSGRHDVIVICHNDSRLSSNRLMQYANAYAPYLSESRGTLIFALLNEACAIDETTNTPNPIQNFARIAGDTFAKAGIRVNVIARHAEKVEQTTETPRRKNKHLSQEKESAPIAASFADIALFLSSPLNTYITGLAVAADA
ncbi:MAG: hypothetical protein ACRBEQ_11180 [Hyphomonas sp.]